MLKLIKKYKALFRYVIINGITTLGYIGLYNLIIFNSCIDYTVANIISYIIMVIIAYYLTKKWAFEDQTKSYVKTMKFVVVRVLMIIISTLIIYVCVELMRINKSVSQMIAVFATFLLSYYMNKRIFEVTER